MSPARDAQIVLEKAFAPAHSLAEANSREMTEALHDGKLGAFDAASDFANCLLPMLAAVKWRGEVRHVAESLPHFANRLDLTGFRNTLAHLGYVTRPVAATPGDLDARLLPCLLVPEGNGPALAILEKTPDGLRVFDGGQNRERQLDHDEVRMLKGTAYLVSEAEKTDAAPDTTNWMAWVARRFRPVLLQLFAITFFINLLALATPLFIMSLYDKVIPARAPAVLGYLVLGMAAAIVFDAGLRFLRGRLIAYTGARVDNVVGAAVLKQVLGLPPSFTERAPVGGQVARLKEFDSIREFFTGPLAGVVLELPFVLIFLAVIAILGGAIALIPIAMIALFVLAGVLLVPGMRRQIKTASAARSERHAFLIETLSNMRAIKESAAETTWMERFRDLSAQAAFTQFKAAQVSYLFQIIAQFLMMIAGLATIAAGALSVMNGVMSVGGLIATMALVWRVLSPLQSGFIALTRLSQVRMGITQINQLMRLSLERDATPQTSTLRKFTGRIQFGRVSMRYTPQMEPALMGVSCTIEPGQVVAVTGASGAGKSSFLKLACGLYQPQAGQVSIDGIDIRQIDPLALRAAIGYLPQECKLFHGTIAQNLRLALPTASDEDLLAACRKASILNEVLALPEGFATRVGDQRTNRLSPGLRQGLGLARIYLRQPPIVLLDEPGRALDHAQDKALIEAINRLRGSATVVMVTHRPSHMRLADIVMVFDSGMLVVAGPPEEVLERSVGGAA